MAFRPICYRGRFATVCRIREDAPRMHLWSPSDKRHGVLRPDPPTYAVKLQVVVLTDEQRRELRALSLLRRPYAIAPRNPDWSAK